jgi:hypothetical protein
MKSAFFLLLIPIILLASCEKKSTSDRHCYLCSINDSVSSTIPALNKAHTKDTVGNYCDLSQAQELFMVREKTRMDTSFARNDTISREFWTITCQQND